jgi:hypothetical protein
MQFIREKVPFKPNITQNINFFLSENTEFNGLQIDIDNFVTEQTGLSINEVKDQETFRYLPENNVNLSAYFYSGGTYANTYDYVGFTTGETKFYDEVVLRSFYFLQVYDTILVENQTLLHSGYLNGFDFLLLNSGNTNYTYNLNDEFSNLYLTNDFINSLNGIITTIYGKISFFNSKTGILELFSHSHTGGAYKEPKLNADQYFEILLDPVQMTYTLPNGTIYAYEYSNTNYINKINKNINVFDNKKPTYPTGTTFINTGKYTDATI